ncbi:gustatory receptor [Homalodisca vitripennis]|nr:gustatory receptor [Homalodisca vitripennis]
MNPIPKELLNFSQLFCGFPFEFYSGSKDKKGKLQFSNKVFLWGLVFNALQIMMTVLGMWTDYKEKLAGRPIRMISDNAYLIILLDLVPLNLLSTVVFFSCSLKYQRFLNILGILKKVDRSLQQDVSDHKAKVKVFFVCIVIVLLILSNSVLACTSPLREGNITSLCYTPTHIMYFAQAALFLHFTQVAQSVAARFRTINASIKEELVRNGHEQLLRRYLPSVRASQSTSDLSSTCKLKSLMDSYWLLCEAVQQTNIFYGDQLIATFLSSFFHVTITLYYFFFFITYGLTMPAIIVGAWIIAHVAHLVLLTRPSTIMSEVADETASVICKLMNMDLDPPLVELLEEPLLLLRKHNARFSALGFFRIHNSTLTGMAGAMTTYVVVLIQFLALKD